MQLRSSLSILTAVFLSTLSAAQYRDSRPIRGCWLRPPDPISAFGPVVKGLADAGVTDLYLETFYHGISTGKQGVFNRRFTYDYLAQAIPIAASYGIRLHCWVESGYWQYGSTGAYNFTSNPDWKVINFVTGTEGGDQASQVFANLCHPGVQQKLRNYTAELAGYPGLWGVQTDYHRMPIDNNYGDTYPTPWSFDAYSSATMASLYAGCVINTNARKPGDTFYNQFLAWRRAGISEAANQMRLGIASVSNDVVFSGAVFPNPTASGDIAKCQDWPTWCANGYIDQVVPMFYATTAYSTNPGTTTVVSQVNTAKANAGNRRVIAGLYPGSGHPSLVTQLDAIKTHSAMEDFAVFDATSLATVANQTAMKNWLASNATPMRSDFLADGAIDSRDAVLMWNRYRGISVSSTGNNARYNFDGDGDVDSVDHAKFREAFRKFRLGENGLLNDSDRAAHTAAVGQPVTPGYASLHDWDGDGDVDSIDRRWLELIGSTTPIAFVNLTFTGVVGAAPRDVTIEFRAPGQTTPLTTWTWKTDVQGRMVSPTPGNGEFEMSIKIDHWLRKTLPVTVNGSDVVVNFSLMNGDVDGDNVVSVFDYIGLSDSFDLSAGDPGFVTSADLDEDDVVSIFDYIQLSDNFDLVGDD